MKFFRTISLVPWLVAAGCSGDEVTPAPTIVSLTATPDVVAAGEIVSLSWATTDATAVRITAPAQPLIERNDASGSAPSAPLTADTTFTLVATGPGGEASQTVDVSLTRGEAPIIVDFSASPDIAEAGARVELGWRVSDTAPLTITVRDGEGVLYTGGESEGAITALPSASTTYLLTARNPAGETDATADVTVNPREGARVLRFEATPEDFEPGQRITLSWDTERSTGTRLEGPGGVLLAAGATSDRFVVAPTDTTTYQLTALSPDGDTTASQTVVLGPSIERFEAVDPVAAAGGTATLAWTVARAERVRIQGPGGFSETSEAARGTLEAPVGAGTNAFTLTAIRAGASRAADVEVLGVGPPVIEALTVTPAQVTGPTSVEVHYRARALTALTLTANGEALRGLAPPQTPGADVEGRVQVVVDRHTVFAFTARNPAGVTTRTATVTVDVLEQEPNDTRDQAQTLGARTRRMVGALATTADQDWYEVVVPAGGWISARTSDGQGGCAVDTRVSLFDATGGPLAIDDDGGVGGCSFVDPVRAPGAAQLDGGPVYLRVEAVDFATGPYILELQVGLPECGNRILEDRVAAEACDDGNQAPSDGCSATCGFEAEQTLSGPPGQLAATDALDPAFDHDVVQLTVTATSYVFAETFTGSATCTADLQLSLHDDQGVQLGVDDADGLGSCAAIHPGRDPWAEIGPGTYWLVLRAEGEATVAGATLEVAVRASATCGNGVLEPPEQCDEAAATTTCNSDCTIPASRSYVAPGPALELAGAIPVAGSPDVFGVTVTSTTYLRVRTQGPTGRECPQGMDTVLRVVRAETGEVVVEADDYYENILGGSVRRGCSRIGRLEGDAPSSNVDEPVLAPGRYRVEVTDYQNDDRIPAFGVRFESQAALVCGNDRIEAGEDCEDGNLVSGDGCGPTCNFDFAPIYEVEPANDTRGGRVSLGVVDGRTTAIGAIPSRRDVDYWSFGVPDTRLVFVDFYDAFNDPFAQTSSLLVTAQVNDGAGLPLSSTAPVRTYFHGALLPAGTYELYVFSRFFFQPIPRYFIDVFAVPLPAPPVAVGSEVEPNPFTSPNAIGTLASDAWVTVQGSLTAGEDDYYTFTVPDGQGPNFVAFLHTTPGALEGCPPIDATLDFVRETSPGNIQTSGFRTNLFSGGNACPHVSWAGRGDFDAVVRVRAGANPPGNYYLSIVNPRRPGYGNR